LRIEEENQRQKRLQKIDDQKKVKEFNDNNKLLHELAKKEAVEEDLRLQAAYAAKLQREEEERANAFSLRMEKLEQYFIRSSEEGAGKKEREEELRVELLLLKNQAEKEARDAENERLKEEARQKRIRDALMENEKLIEQKRHLVTKQREDDKVFGAQYRKESEEYIAAEKKKMEQIRLKNKKLEEEIKKQMAVEKHDTDKGISYQERELNKSVLKKVTEDPNIIPYVQRQLRISTVSSRA
jgi:hypothetical protein